jgi:hemerythrin
LIDAQHKMLIKRLNDLNQALATGQGPAKIASTLNFLIDYTDFHFTAEEQHMTKNNYPQLGAHKEQHEVFKTTLANLETDLAEEGATQGLADSIDKLLVQWLLNHIRTVDVAFGKFLQEKGIEIPEEA